MIYWFLSPITILYSRNLSPTIQSSLSFSQLHQIYSEHFSISYWCPLHPDSFTLANPNHVLFQCPNLQFLIKKFEQKLIIAGVWRPWSISALLAIPDSVIFLEIAHSSHIYPPVKYNYLATPTTTTHAPQTPWANMTHWKHKPIKTQWTVLSSSHYILFVYIYVGFLFMYSILFSNILFVVFIYLFLIVLCVVLIISGY